MKTFLKNVWSYFECLSAARAAGHAVRMGNSELAREIMLNSCKPKSN